MSKGLPIYGQYLFYFILFFESVRLSAEGSISSLSLYAFPPKEEGKYCMYLHTYFFTSKLSICPVPPGTQCAHPLQPPTLLHSESC